MEDKLTVGQAAIALRYHPNHIRRLIRQGVMTAAKFGQFWIIDVKEVERVKSLQDEYGRLTKNPD